MSKDYFILNRGRVIYAPGHYDREDAERIARNEADRNPTKTYTVVHVIAKFQFPRKKK